MKDRWSFVGLLAPTLALLVEAWMFVSLMEARSFNAVTGKHVTMWQAMWIDLRVMEPVK